MCFSLQWVGQLLVWLVAICAAIAIIKLLVPLLAGLLPPNIAGIVVGIINIILWAIVAIAVIWLVIDLLSCLLGSGGLSLGPPRPR